MRTTVTLADDVAAAVETVRRERGVGVSEAVNDLVRSGLTRANEKRPFVQKTYDMGEALIDLTNVAEAREILDGLDAR